MKKVTIILLLLGLMTLSAGCRAPKVTVPESADRVDLEWERDLVVDGVLQDGADHWNYEITTYTVVGEHCAQDDSGRVLTRHSYQIPSMEVGRAEEEKAAPERAFEAARSFNSYFDQVLEDEVAWFEEMAAAADEDYRAVGHQEDSHWQDDGFQYTDESTLTFWYNDHVICITTTRYSYTGGPHPTVWRSSVTFDLATGKPVAVGDLTGDVAQLSEAVEQELLRQAEERQTGEAAAEDEEILVYYDDYAETMHAWMERSVSFDEEGMTVIFSVYDIAPHGAGEQTFLIPYEMLDPYLNSYGRTVLELD